MQTRLLTLLVALTMWAAPAKAAQSAGFTWDAFGGDLVFDFGGMSTEYLVGSFVDSLAVSPDGQTVTFWFKKSDDTVEQISFAAGTTGAAGLDAAQVQALVGTMVTGNTEDGVEADYDATTKKINFKSTRLPEYNQSQTQVLHSRAGVLFWELINEVPDTPDLQSGIGDFLRVRGTDDQAYHWAKLTDEDILNLAKEDRVDADRSKYLGVSATDKNVITLLDAPASSGGAGTDQTARDAAAAAARAAATADGKAVAAAAAAATADGKAVAAQNTANAANTRANDNTREVRLARSEAQTADGKAVAAQQVADRAEGKADAAQIDADIFIEAGPAFIAGDASERNLYVNIRHPINSFPQADILWCSVSGQPAVLVAYNPGSLSQTIQVGLIASTMNNIVSSGRFGAGSFIDVELRIQKGTAMQNGQINPDAIYYTRTIDVPVVADDLGTERTARIAADNALGTRIDNINAPNPGREISIAPTGNPARTITLPTDYRSYHLLFLNWPDQNGDVEVSLSIDLLPTTGTRAYRSGGQGVVTWDATARTFTLGGRNITAFRSAELYEAGVGGVDQTARDAAAAAKTVADQATSDLAGEVTARTNADNALGSRIDAIRQLPTFPAEGSRDNKVAKFDGNTLGWEEDAAGGGGSSGIVTHTLLASDAASGQRFGGPSDRTILSTRLSAVASTTYMVDVVLYVSQSIGSGENMEISLSGTGDTTKRLARSLGSGNRIYTARFFFTPTRTAAISLFCIFGTDDRNANSQFTVRSGSSLVVTSLP